MKHIIKSLLISSVVVTTAAMSLPTQAQSYGSGSNASAQQSAHNSFTKKRYSIKGSWKVTQQNGQRVIEFGNDFKTKSGPDLKVYLSKSTVENLDGSQVEATSHKLSVLKSNRGTQSYVIPAGINLSDYKSVIIHCEAFSVLWGGFNL